jgi:hypothetical protein
MSKVDFGVLFLTRVLHQTLVTFFLILSIASKFATSNLTDTSEAHELSECKVPFVRLCYVLTHDFVSTLA